MFEPEFNDKEIAANRLRRDEIRDKNAHLVGRSGKVNWCKCNNCVSMATDMESVCCVEDDDVKSVSGDYECIVNHPTFEHHILSQDGLQILRQVILQNSNKSFKKRELRKTMTNKNWRYLAYRQFVYWINSWKNLGKGYRVVIPSCAVKKIRESYPEQSGVYVGFFPSTSSNTSQDENGLQFPA